jgi:predicted RNA-binding Zn-ribbon protein involved in translation (DUF1610 family)
VDLERLFRQIVVNLSASDPTGVHRPRSIAELRDTIVPYRANRRALQIESSEDYELALLRLCAGEDGLVRIEPVEAQTDLAAEVRSSNPDLTLLQQHDKAVVHLDPGAVAKILDPNPDLRFAPNSSVEPVEQKTPRKRARPKPDAPPAAPQLANCTRCRGTLPGNRVVNFCPHCGQNLTRRQCPDCRTELEPGWKHCVGCGTSLQELR